MQHLGVYLILFARHNPLTPRAPTPQFPSSLSWQPLYRLFTFVFVHLDTLTDSCVLLVLDLEDSTNALDLLRKVARTSPPLWRIWGVVTLVSRSQRGQRFCLAGLVLHDPGAQAVRASTTLDALLTLTRSCAYATQVMAVSCTPAPATNVIGIGVLQVLPTGCAKPNHVVAIAWCSLKSRCGERSRLTAVPEDRT